jgi:hypothetical protein
MGGTVEECQEETSSRTKTKLTTLPRDGVAPRRGGEKMMRFTRTGAGALLSALLVTAAAASPAAAIPRPLPPESTSCSVDGYKGEAALTVERVGDRVVTKVSGYRITGGDPARDRGNFEIELYGEWGGLVRKSVKKSGDSLKQDGSFHELDFEWRADAEKSPRLSPKVGPNYKYFVTLKFIFDKAGADPTCTAKAIKVD